MKAWILSGVMMAMAGGSALAAPPDPIERAKDRQAIREDIHEVRADQWDRARLEALLAEYAKARKARNGPAIGELDQRFMTEIRSEVVESKVEVVEKVQEVGQSAHERNGERHEVVKDVVTGHPVKAARDAADLRDDRRDVRDDRRDLAAESAALARKKAIRDEFKARVGLLDAKSVLAKEALIKRAIAEAKLEVRADVQEKREDKRELREDRRDDRRPD